MEQQQTTVLSQEEYKEYLKWKALSKQKRLITLPCCVKDKIHTFYNSDIEECIKHEMTIDEIVKEICEEKSVYAFEIRHDGCWIVFIEGFHCNSYSKIPIEEFGKTVFLTQQEEYEKLKQIIKTNKDQM